MASAPFHADLCIDWFDQLDSTNAQAHREMIAGRLHPGWIAARRQSAGKGRRGRTWFSQPGNFMGSFLWPIGQDLAVTRGLALPIGMAVRSAILELYAGTEDVRCKWPNDVFIGHGKCAGILIESCKAQDGAYWGIAGIGVNLVPTPDVTDRLVASVAESTNNAPAPNAFLDILSRELVIAIRNWPPHDPAQFQRAWQSCAYGLGSSVTLEDGRRGLFKGIETTGEASVALASGQRLSVQAGDLVFDEVEAG
ncbi:MAG: biotin--[acetyl-CoA-carboxylase] ligase [Pseudomonadota bacterium]